jgi:hypothetical protein
VIGTAAGRLDTLLPCATPTRPGFGALRISRARGGAAHRPRQYSHHDHDGSGIHDPVSSPHRRRRNPSDRWA